MKYERYVSPFPLRANGTSGFSKIWDERERLASPDVRGSGFWYYPDISGRDELAGSRLADANPLRRDAPACLKPEGGAKSRPPSACQLLSSHARGRTQNTGLTTGTEKL